MYAFFIILMGIFIYSKIRRKALEKQVELFNRLLYIEKSPEKYIEEINKILFKFQSDKERNINLIQKTTGLFYLGEFDEAVKILKEDITKIPPNWQVVYYHNLLLSMYFNGNKEKVNEMLTEVRSILDLYYKRDYNKVTIELIYAVSDFFSGNINNCKEFFNNFIDVAKNDYRIALGYYFIGKINELEGNIEDAEDKLEKARAYGQGSFIEYL